MLVATVLLTTTGFVIGQVQVPHGPVPTPGQVPQAAALYGPLPHGAARTLPPGPPKQGTRKSENLFLSPSFDPFFSNAGFVNPGFHVSAGYPGFYGAFGLSPQQNGDGSWNFIALPIPLENQTIPDNSPQNQVAQAKLWGPVYKEGQGWVYGEAGMILVPKYPPYAPPGYVTPAALQPPPSSPAPPSTPAVADGTAAIDTNTGETVDTQMAESSRIKAEGVRRKGPRK